MIADASGFLTARQDRDIGNPVGAPACTMIGDYLAPAIADMPRCACSCLFCCGKLTGHISSTGATNLTIVAKPRRRTMNRNYDAEASF